LRSWRHAAQIVDDEQVLAAVLELSAAYRAPSTSLVTWRLADGASVTARFQSAVRDSLHRLQTKGELSCIVHRGTHRWSPRAGDRARAGRSRSRSGSS
jgi:hypothetical protein